MVKTLTMPFLFSWICLSAAPPALPAPAEGSIDPVPFTDVQVKDAFWSPRMETNRKVSIPYAFKMCEETGRIDNFAVAGKLKEGKFQGIYFNDSDLFKVIEGAAYSLAIQRDPELEKYLDDVIRKIAAAQEPDGYLYTARTLARPDLMPPGGKDRWSDLAGGHELYCVGHLYEGAVAHWKATGKRSLLDVALKNAGLVMGVFGPGKRTGPDGHQEIEIGLAKLFRATGERKYLEQAKFFLDQRGRPTDTHRLYGDYCQDHIPVTEQREAVGHSVRAGYMYAAMADIAALIGEKDYEKALDLIWEDVVGKKMYLTGGVGARGGIEGYGAPYELPNLSAYCETCAAIALALWNHRMFLLKGDGKYIDIVELVIYNGFLSGVSLEGNRFFYPNPLESQRGAARAPWFDCACCPSNVVRFVPSIPGYAYARRGVDLYVNLFIGGSATIQVQGNPVKLTQETRYPWGGAVKIAVDPEKPAEFTLRVRIPGWARGRPVPSDLYRYLDEISREAALKVNGEPAALEIEKGYAWIRRAWTKGDTVELNLPMPARRVVAHEKVLDDKGRAAVVRGPVVFCAEGADQKDGRVLSLLLPDDSRLRPRFRSDLLGGVVTIGGKARSVARKDDGTPVLGNEVDLLLIPYHAWAHRERGEMAVWLARELGAAKPLPAPTIAFRSKTTSSAGGDVRALTDQLEPRSSGDHSNPYFHWWPRKGTKEWVQLDFERPERISAVEAYWFDDTGIGECRVPASWTLKVKAGGEWKDAPGAKGFGVEKDRYNRTAFDPVLADGVRLEVQLPENFAGGIHEIRVSAAPGGGGSAGGGGQSGSGAGGAAAGAAGGAQAAAPAGSGEGSPNLLPNPSFEEERRESPRGWRSGTWGGKGSFEHARIGRTGSRSVALSSGEGGDIAWTAMVPLEPGAKYRLSGWIKTENVEAKTGKGALLNLHNFQPLATEAVTGTRDWTRVELTFESGDQDSAQVNCLFGGWGLSTGKAWYDDLRLEMVEAPKPQELRIAVDASRPGQGISKYIYGQFIEHLGRCIYGGIWAEVLEDRKFFYPVGARQSPWKPLGPPESVSMVRESAFVGAHTPEIKLSGDGKPCGIVQGGLGLRKGVVYAGRIWLSGSSDAGPVFVTLSWGDGVAERETVKVEKVGGDWAKTALRFTAGAGTDDGRLEIRAEGKGTFRVGTVSLMPGDNVQGMRADTLALLKELDSPVYRWPGGNFVSGYNWKDGLGDPDRRPPRKNPAWTGVEHNDFGLDEFMYFCRVLGTEPYIAVNSGLGDTGAAREEVEYANGSPDTPMGKLRAQNGHPEPYKVRFWSIGNEMYGGWQLGHMPLSRYVEKHNEFAKAMRAVDPKIQLIAVGDAGPWSEGMLKGCAEHMDLISEHFYCQERPGLGGHVRQIPSAIRAKAEAHRRYRREIDALRGKDIRIALDEWNYWYGPHVFGELGTRYFLKDALGIAAGLNEYARQSDIIFMANYAQTVNVIGCIKTSKTAAEFESTGLVLKLYRRRFGTIPVATEASRLLDAQAALSDDRSSLTLAVVNPTMGPVEVPLELKGAKLAGSGIRYEISGSDPMAFNDPGKPLRVKIEESKVEGLPKEGPAKLKLSPCSVTLFVISTEP